MATKTVYDCWECPLLVSTFTGKPACAAQLFFPEINWPWQGTSATGLLRPLPLTVHTDVSPATQTRDEIHRHIARLEALREEIDQEIALAKGALQLHAGPTQPELDDLVDTIANYLAAHSDGVSRETIYSVANSNNTRHDFIEKACTILLSDGRAIRKTYHVSGQSWEFWYPVILPEIAEE